MQIDSGFSLNTGVYMRVLFVSSVLFVGARTAIYINDQSFKFSDVNISSVDDYTSGFICNDTILANQIQNDASASDYFCVTLSLSDLWIREGQFRRGQFYESVQNMNSERCTFCC